MKDFGLAVPENKNYEEFIFSSKKSHSENADISYTVEGDWSGGAFLLVAGAIAGEVVAEGLDIHSTQADKVIIEALQHAGAFVAIEDKKIIIRKSELKAFEFDATDCPDLFPPLVALAAYCKGITKIKGLSRLAYKESNRGITLQEEFGKMSVTIELHDDVMFINGNGIVKGNNVSSHHDHRIAMACAVAGLGAPGNTIIENADAISKSYPNFYEHLKLIGASVTSLNK
jgi:3-phosphoshikimate 1-carboxyvinyltransferase